MSGSEKQYYFQSRGRTIGPVTERKIRELYQKGAITDSTLVSEDGKQWKPLSDLAKKKHQATETKAKASQSPPLVPQTRGGPDAQAQQPVPEGWLVCDSCGRPVPASAEACLTCGAPIASMAAAETARLPSTPANAGVSNKRILVAVLLLLFFWPLGLHAFYLGRPALGFVHFGMFCAWLFLNIRVVVLGSATEPDSLRAAIPLLALFLTISVILLILFLCQYFLLVLGKFEDGEKRRVAVW